MVCDASTGPQRTKKMSRNRKPQPEIDQADTEKRIDAMRENRARILIRLVTAISRACIMYGTRYTSHFGLSVSQTIVLGELFGQNGCRQEDLRESVFLDKGNVTRALQRLEESGLVERKQDPQDRRVVRIYFTEKALSIEREMFLLAVLWDEKLTMGFTHEEHEMLVDLLLRMEVNAKALARGGAPPADGAES